MSPTESPTAEPGAITARETPFRAVLFAARSSGGPLASPTVVLWLAAFVLLVFLSVPLVSLIWMTGERPGSISSRTLDTLRSAGQLTIVTSLISLAAIIALGTPLGYLLARRRVPAASLIETLIDLPMVLPPAVAGIALLMAFGRRGIVGQYLDRSLGLTLAFTPVAVIVAQTFVAAPFYVRAARAGFAYVAHDLEQVAATLGASPFRVFRSVTLPIAWPSLAAGAVLAWARAVGEFGATIMFAGNLPGRTQTMSLAIYGRYEAGDLTTALVLATALLFGSLIALLGVRALGSMRDGPPSIR